MNAAYNMESRSAFQVNYFHRVDKGLLEESPAYDIN